MNLTSRGDMTEYDVQAVVCFLHLILTTELVFSGFDISLLTQCQISLHKYKLIPTRETNTKSHTDPVIDCSSEGNV